MISFPALAAALAIWNPVAAGDSVRADSDIRQSALRHSADIRRCYETEALSRNPSLSGTLDVEVTILPTGVVSKVGIPPTRLRGRGVAELSACVTTAVRNWRFDRGPFAIERVILPFQLIPDVAVAHRAARAAGGRQAISNRRRRAATP
jgi:hypothetical protein